MKISFIPIFILLSFISCSRSYKDKAQHDAIDIELQQEQVTDSFVDSIFLPELSEKSGLFSSILDATVDLAKNKQLYSDLCDYDCFILCLWQRNEYNDTICFVGPSKMKYMLFYEDLDSGYIGVWKWKHYPVFLHGNIVSSFFKETDNHILFYSGLPVLDGTDIQFPRFRISNKSFIMVNESYP